MRELAEAALLRPLVAEHRTAREKLKRQVLREPVGEHGTDDAGGIFRPQRDLLAAAVGEGVHFLGDDVGRLADGPREHLGKLEDRRRDLLIPVALGDAARRVNDSAMSTLLFRQEILGAAHRLQGGHRSVPK